MDKNFNVSEILRIAVNVEKAGQKLYSVLETKAGNEDLRQTWRYLKEQEEEHQRIFQEMLDNIGDYIVEDFSPGEYDAYLSGTAQSYIFSQKLIEEKVKQEFSSDLEAVEFGISIEKDSILTYTAFKEAVKPEKKEAIDNVINEEKKHFVKLSALRKILKEG